MAQTIVAACASRRRRPLRSTRSRRRPNRLQNRLVHLLEIESLTGGVRLKRGEEKDILSPPQH